MVRATWSRSALPTGVAADAVLDDRDMTVTLPPQALA
jgi:hypothetical protein